MAMPESSLSDTPREFAIAWRRRHLAMLARRTPTEIIADGERRGLTWRMALFAHAFGPHAVADHPMCRAWREPWDP